MNKELAQRIFELVEKSAKFVEIQSTDLIREFLNYSLMVAIFSLVKVLLFLTIPYFIFRFSNVLVKSINNEIEEYEKQKVKPIELVREYKTRNLLIFFRNCIPAIISIMILSYSISHIENIGKIVVAPKLFILQETKNILGK